MIVMLFTDNKSCFVMCRRHWHQHRGAIDIRDSAIFASPFRFRARACNVDIIVVVRRRLQRISILFERGDVVFSVVV
jgi:hypothetical protein